MKLRLFFLVFLTLVKALSCLSSPWLLLLIFLLLLLSFIEATWNKTLITKLLIYLQICKLWSLRTFYKGCVSWLQGSKATCQQIAWQYLCEVWDQARREKSLQFSRYRGITQLTEMSLSTTNYFVIYNSYFRTPLSALILMHHWSYSGMLLQFLFLCWLTRVVYCS